MRRQRRGFLGKPYEPNAVIKNDIEFILMRRKAGGYRHPGRRSSGRLGHRDRPTTTGGFGRIWTDVGASL